MSLSNTFPSLPAGLYRHYKGGLYQLIGLAAHSETDERMVVYVSLTELPGPRLRVRPAAMWSDGVIWPDGSPGPRFQYVGVEIPEPPAQSS